MDVLSATTLCLVAIWAITCKLEHLLWNMTWLHVRFRVVSIMVAKSISERTEIALVALIAVTLARLYGFIVYFSVQYSGLL
jgi:hypothetical protein